MEARNPITKRIAIILGAVVLSLVLATTVFVANASAEVDPPDCAPCHGDTHRPGEDNPHGYPTLESKEGEDKESKEAVESGVSNTDSLYDIDLAETVSIGELNFSYPRDYQLSINSDGVVQLFSPDENIVIMATSTPIDMIASYENTDELANALISQNAYDISSEDVFIGETQARRTTYFVDSNEDEDANTTQCVMNCFSTDNAFYIVLLTCVDRNSNLNLLAIEDTFLLDNETNNGVRIQSSDGSMADDKSLDSSSALATELINKDSLELFQNKDNGELGEDEENLDDYKSETLAMLDYLNNLFDEIHASSFYTASSFTAYTTYLDTFIKVLEDKSSTRAEVDEACGTFIASIMMLEAKNFEKSEYGSYDYREILRYSDTHAGEKMVFAGEAIQVSDGDTETHVLLVVRGSSDDLVMIGYSPDEIDFRVLEDDKLTVYGTYIGAYTYETTSGASKTVPAIWADRIELIN